MAIPAILDCDPGTDDALALFLSLASPELDVRAVTVVGGNTALESTLSNALALTALTGKTIPVHPGAPRPLLGSFTPKPDIHGTDGLGGIALPPGGPPSNECAPDAIRRILRTAPEPVTLIGIGPVTNLALALMTEPALLPKVREIVLMTGAWAEGNITPSAEFNAWSDPEALAIVLACGSPIVLATLELTAQALVTQERIAAWRALGSGRCLQTACDIQAAVPPSSRLGGSGAPLHDPCAVAWVLDPTFFTTRPCTATVELGLGPSRGRTVIDRWGRTGAPPNAVLLETLNAERFFRLLGQRFARLP